MQTPSDGGLCIAKLVMSTVIQQLPPTKKMILFAVLVVLPVAILQLGATQQCSCSTGIAVIAEDDLKKEIRAH